VIESPSQMADKWHSRGVWNFHGNSMELPCHLCSTPVPFVNGRKVAEKWIGISMEVPWNFHTPRPRHLSAIWEAVSITPQSPGRYTTCNINIPN